MKQIILAKRDSEKKACFQKIIRQVFFQPRASQFQSQYFKFYVKSVALPSLSIGDLNHRGLCKLTIQSHFQSSATCSCSQDTPVYSNRKPGQKKPYSISVQLFSHREERIPLVFLLMSLSLLSLIFTTYYTCNKLFQRLINNRSRAEAFNQSEQEIIALCTTKKDKLSSSY